MRSNSRITSVDWLSYEIRYPIILSARSWITKLIIIDIHLKMNHYGGTNYLLSKLNKRFWVIGARRLVKEVRKECIRCQFERKKRIIQKMTPLPKFRFQKPLMVFTKTAVDFT